MNKGEFLKVVAEKACLTRKQAEAAYEATVKTIAEALKAGEKVSFVGFANFEVKQKAAKEGFNPLTKEKIKIPARKVPVVKFGKPFKDLF